MAFLVCLKTNRRVYLCNSLTHQLWQLPMGYYHFGFGYIHSRNEYKVVHLFYTSLRSFPCDHQLKFLLIDGKKLYHLPLPGLLVNECMYWLARHFPRGELDRILSFDFENEKFLTIYLVHHLLKIFTAWIWTRYFAYRTQNFRKSSILDLWILQDKISCTWVKEYSINLVNFGSKNSCFIL